MSPSTLAEEPNLTFLPKTGPIILPLITKSSDETDPITFADFSITNFEALISPSRTPSSCSAPFEDIFPTILEILGYKLDDNTANLGVSLLSNKKTLAEELSLSELSIVFENSARLQRLLWLPDEDDDIK